MISSDSIRGYTDTMILYCLLDEASYGYEISKTINELCDGLYIMKETTLYSSLNRLVKNGSLESFKGTETNGKERTYYRLTEEGKDHYRAKCDEWEEITITIPKFIRKI